MGWDYEIMDEEHAEPNVLLSAELIVSGNSAYQRFMAEAGGTFQTKVQKDLFIF